VYRSDGGVRLYESGQFDNLREINELRQQGFGIEEVRLLLDEETAARDLERLAARHDVEAAAASARARCLREAARSRRPVAM
jgi:DNA-binding transcriptional MerR regulator